MNRQAFTGARIEYVLVFVRGDTPEDISLRVGRVAEIAISHDAVVHDMVCELVVIAFGTIPASLRMAGKRASLVEHLGRELSSHVKIIHGAADGHYGNIGSGVRMAYSFVLPRFGAILGALSRLEYGQVEEFEKRFSLIAKRLNRPERKREGGAERLSNPVSNQERSVNRHKLVLPTCPKRLGCVLCCIEGG
jgi:hypothetical protein